MSEIESFLTTNYPKLKGFLTLQVGQKEIAEELAQEAMARAWSNWSKVRKMDRPDAWLLRVGTNLAMSHLRRRRLEHRVMSSSQHQEVARVHDLDTAIVVRETLQELPRKQRVALILRFYLDLSFDEVASVMDIPTSTARSHVRRALKHLEKSLLVREVGDEPRYA